MVAYSGEAQIINYQGRVAVGGVNFDGTGQFKFALVNGGTNTAVSAQATSTEPYRLSIVSPPVSAAGSKVLLLPTVMRSEPRH